MKILMIGAGYIGKALLPLLQEQSHDLTITTTQESKIKKLQPYGTVLHLKPENQKKFQYHVNHADIIIVLVAPNESNTYEETYLQTAINLVSIVQNRKVLPYFIYTSSTSVCEGLEGIVKEETSLFPRSKNAQILLATEETYLKSGADVCILRLGGIYGPDRTLNKRASFFSGKTLPGDGNEPTNNIHQEDILRAIMHSITHRLKGVHHLVNDDHLSRKELYLSLCNKNNLPPPTWDHLLKNSKGTYIVSNEKIKNSGFVFLHHSILIDYNIKAF